MNIDLARYMVRVNFRCGRELQELLHLLKQNLPEKEYNTYAHAIAAIIAEMGQALTDKAMAACPTLSQEIEKSMAQYDRFL